MVILENWQERILVNDFFIATIAHGRPLTERDAKFLQAICHLFIDRKAEAWNICATAFAANLVELFNNQLLINTRQRQALNCILWSWA